MTLIQSIARYGSGGAYEATIGYGRVVVAGLIDERMLVEVDLVARAA